MIRAPTIACSVPMIDIIDINSKTSKMFSCFIQGITWYGHDFLDSLRNDGVWSQTKEKLKPVGSISFEVIKSIAVECAKNMMGLP